MSLEELNEREEGAVILPSSVLGNLDGEGRQIDDCTRTHWAYISRKPAEPIAQHSNTVRSLNAFVFETWVFYK